MIYFHTYRLKDDIKSYTVPIKVLKNDFNINQLRTNHEKSNQNLDIKQHCKNGVSQNNFALNFERNQGHILFKPNLNGAFMLTKQSKADDEKTSNNLSNGVDANKKNKSEKLVIGLNPLQIHPHLSLFNDQARQEILSKAKSTRYELEGINTQNNISAVIHNKDGSLVENDDQEEDKSDCIVLGHTRYGELSQRRDVVFKTIVRDMRKYFIEDFNKMTSYVKKKRYNKKDYYLTCIDNYIKNEHFHQVSTKNGRNIKDFNIYLGALIYPKEFSNIISKKQHLKLIDETYSTLYKFSLSKMKNYLIKDAIFNLFMHYYNKEIVEGDRLDTNKTMKKHKSLYLEAFKILISFMTKSKRDRNAFQSCFN